MAIPRQRAVPKDANRVPIVNAGVNLVCEKTVTFAGGTTNGIGDYDGTGNPVNLFTVTGEVFIKVVGIVQTDLAGASGTVAVGVSGDTAELLPVTTGTDLDVGEVWHDATPDSKGELSSVVAEKIVGNGADVILTVGTANITSGVIKFLCFWYPLSVDAEVTVA